jgi:hypothetical protein
MTDHDTGTREEWLAARIELLAAEKELTRQSDELARRRRDLPWVRLEKDGSGACTSGSTESREGETRRAPKATRSTSSVGTTNTDPSRRQVLRARGPRDLTNGVAPRRQQWSKSPNVARN